MQMTTKTKMLTMTTTDVLNATTTKHLVLQYLNNNRYATINELVTYEPKISSDQYGEAIQALTSEGRIRPFLRGDFSAASVWCLRTSDPIDINEVRVAPPPKSKKKKAQPSLADVPIDPHSLDIINRFAQERSISTIAAAAYLLGKAAGLLQLVQEVQAQTHDNSRGV